ncbi:hypothetical protein DFH08DRAFT_816811 [Mycena albidolilacea]|uniref:Uncharacterized protein n=1 Tax=Mycena albidolilacea TaxID=1033008 RepID=A0AAD7EH97_9AGAR|nr:hypothetical protein DFH08DRAFT_816811 [Mycena albidolilacea]
MAARPTRQCSESSERDQFSYEVYEEPVAESTKCEEVGGRIDISLFIRGGRFYGKDGGKSSTRVASDDDASVLTRSLSGFPKKELSSLAFIFVIDKEIHLWLSFGGETEVACQVQRRFTDIGEAVNADMNLSHKCQIAVKNVKKQFRLGASGDRIEMGKLDYAKTVLTFAETAAEGIPAPGLKSALGVVNQLVDMFDTMKGNKEDLPELKERLRPLTNIDTSVCNESLKQRLNSLQKNLKPIVEQCELLIKFHEEHKFRPFLLSYSIGKNIRRMEEKISIQIQDFTAGGGITIEGLVRDMKEQCMYTLQPYLLLHSYRDL